jgi:bifunctional non-homologous end joining protein LigD
MLKAEYFESWPKLTGGKGLHVMVPIEPSMTHDAAHNLCKAFAQRLSKRDHRRYTLSANLAERQGRLFIDALVST